MDWVVERELNERRCERLTDQPQLVSVGTTNIAHLPGDNPPKPTPETARLRRAARPGHGPGAREPAPEREPNSEPDFEPDSDVVFAATSVSFSYRRGYLA